MAEQRDNTSVLGIPLIIGAVAFGLVAAALAYVYLKSEKAALIEKYAGADRKQVMVLVAAKDLPKGTVLRREVLSQRKIPAGFVSNDAVPATAFDKYIGRVLEADVSAGKPILKSYLDTGFPVDFSDTVPVGRRALTIQVDDVNSVAGFIRPGNRIDLFVNIPSGFSGFSAGFITADLVDAIPAELRNSIPPALLDAARGANTGDTEIQQLVAGALPKDVILPVLQNVRVLATGRDPYREQLDQLSYPQPRSERNFNTVTLDVTPREAALVTAALDKGDMLAILRNRNDEGLSDFSTVSAQDLFTNAFKMAQSEGERRTRVAVAKGIDQAGNLVDAEGNRIMSREQLAAAGLTVNADGQIVDKNGKVIDPANMVVTADGRVLDKAALAAAGLSVNASGQIVDKDGNVVSAEDIVVTADGKVVTKQQLAASGLSVNENGEIVDASGKVVDSTKLVMTADGKILTTEQLAAAGLSVNDKGEIVDAAGNVIDPAKLIVSANGQILSPAELAAAGLTVNENGEVVDASGKVVDPSSLVTDANGKIINPAELAAAGLTVNERGEVVDKDGNLVDPATLVKTKNGVLSSAQLAAAGLKVDASGNVIDAAGEVLSAAQVASVAANTPIAGGARNIDMIVGGSPTDGVTKTTTLKTVD
jgi:pilus assembly protein CpaB